MNRPADIIVVGGGVIGLACACALSQAGLRVHLLERDSVGSGASGASLGALIPSTATFHGPTQALQRGSLWLYPEFVAELQALTGIDVGYVRCGLLDIMQGEARRQNAHKEIEVASQEWPHAGDAPVMEVIENSDAARLEPHAKFDGDGVRQCRASAQVRVDRLLCALEKACTRSGVSVETNAEVRELQIGASRVTGVRTAQADVPAGGVLVAAGAWTPQLHPVLAELAPIAPVRGQALRLRTHPGHLQHIVKRRTAYLLPQPDGDILVGSTTEPEAGYAARVTADGVAQLTEGALQLSPALEKAAVVAAWSGLRPKSLTHHPILGAVSGIDGLYVAAGHYKTGIACAPLTGQLAAEIVSGTAPTLHVAPFSPAPLPDGA